MPEHELLHAFEVAIPKAGHCDVYTAFNEATAVWAETQFSPTGLVEPGSQRSHLLHDYTHNHHMLGLLSWRNEDDDTAAPGYGAFPLFVHLAREYDPHVIFDAIREAELHTNPYDAIGDALGEADAFSRTFKDFALAAWGEAPYDELHGWLGAETLPTRIAVSADLEDEDHKDWSGERYVTPYSYAYYVVATETADPPARLRINNPVYDVQSSAVHVQLLYRRSGEDWHYEDLPGTSTRSSVSISRAMTSSV